VRVAFVVLTACGRLHFGPDGLIADYHMEDLGSGGDHLTDSVGGHDGTCVSPGCPIAVAGRIGNALLFDGVDDQIRVPSDPELDTTRSFTIAAWIQLSVPAAHENHVATKAFGSGTLDSWSLVVDTDQTVGFSADMPTMAHKLTEPMKLGPSVWHHLAARWDGTTQDILIDGAVVATEVSDDDAWDDNTVNIGADIENGALAGPFAGIIDEVRLYDYSLADDEIALLVAE